MKKKKGDVQQFFIQMIGIIVSFAILLYGVYYSQTIITYNNANQLARQYILKIESNGGLSSIELAHLKSSLEKLNLEDVSIEGNISLDPPKNKPEYGQDVVLKISFTQNITGLDVDGLNFSFTKHKKNVVITKISTAKY